MKPIQAVKARHVDGTARFTAALAGFLCAACLAEVATDGSLGAAQSLAGPDFAITSDLGREVGSNLFHSFSVFNIATGESATFSGPGSIANIISRVTGGSGSSIDGGLNSSITGANLYLINPHGIVFGENATLNISGSFHATTAAYLSLADGGRFDAIAPGNTVLTSAPPQAFGFLGDAPAPIDVEGSRLRLEDGQTLTLAAGDISVSEGLLLVPAGAIQLVSVGSPGEADVDAAHVTLEQFSQWGDIDITHTGDLATRFVFPLGIVGNLDTSADSGGRILIRGGRFVLDNGQVFADSTNGSGAQVDIDLAGELRASNESRITVDVFGAGSGGVLELDAPRLVLVSGGRLQADNSGSGVGGTLQLNVAESVSISGQSPHQDPFIGNSPSGLFAESVNTGTGGTIEVNTATLSLADGGRIEISTRPAGGAGGAVVINAADVTVGDGGLIRGDALGAGDAGTIAINAQTLRLHDGGFVSSSSLDSGSAGDITVNAQDSITVTGSNAATSSSITTNAFSSGNGGRITLNAPALTVSEGGRIQSGVGINPDVPGLPAATAETRAGSIAIQTDSLNLSAGGQISTQSENAGQAGDINLTSGSLAISGVPGDVKSGLFSTAAGSGAGGSLTVAADSVAMSGGAINASSAGEGDGGSINLSANTLNLTNGAELGTSTAGAGSGGEVDVRVSGTVAIDGEDSDGFSSGVYTRADGSGDGGAIDVTAAQVLLTDTGVLTSANSGSGDGGRIGVAATRIEVDGGRISTDAVDGDAGEIDLSGSELTLRGGGQVTSSTSGAGSGGRIDVAVTGGFAVDGNGGGAGGSGLSSLAGGSGAGGDIDVAANVITLDNAATLTAESTGSGNAGDIHVAAADLTMNDSAISTQASQADGGNVKIDVTGTVLLRESAMTAAVAGGLGDGGNVGIDPQFVILDNSRVLASAIGGDGGNIRIVTDHFVSSGSSVLDASSQLGIDGTVNVLSPDEDLDSNLVELPASYLDAVALLSEPCSTRRHADRSSLTVAARRALPLTPQSPQLLLSSLADRHYARVGQPGIPAAEGVADPAPGIRFQSGWLASAMAVRLYGCRL
jgi:filamentous hemagglutinin family protein